MKNKIVWVGEYLKHQAGVCKILKSNIVSTFIQRFLRTLSYTDMQDFSFQGEYKILERWRLDKIFFCFRAVGIYMITPKYNFTLAAPLSQCNIISIPVRFRAILKASQTRPSKNGIGDQKFLVWQNIHWGKAHIFF